MNGSSFLQSAYIHTTAQNAASGCIAPGIFGLRKPPKSRRSKEGVPDGVLCIRRADACHSSCGIFGLRKAAQKPQEQGRCSRRRILYTPSGHLTQLLWNFRSSQAAQKPQEQGRCSRRRIMYTPSGRLTQLLWNFRRLSAVFPGIVGLIQVFKIAVFIEIFR